MVADQLKVFHRKARKMFRLPFITICWAILFAHNFIICSSNGLEEPLLNKLIEKNFDVKFSLQPRADILTAPKYKFTYTRGIRIPGNEKQIRFLLLIEIFFFLIPNSCQFLNIFLILFPLGDRLVASAFESRQWPVAQNVTLNLTYPRAGVGYNISYVEIYVTQVLISIKHE